MERLEAEEGSEPNRTGSNIHSGDRRVAAAAAEMECDGSHAQQRHVRLIAVVHRKTVLRCRHPPCTPVSSPVTYNDCHLLPCVADTHAADPRLRYFRRRTF